MEEQDDCWRSGNPNPFSNKATFKVTCVSECHIQLNLSNYKDDNPMTSLSNLCQHLTTFIVKLFPLYLIKISVGAHCVYCHLSFHFSSNELCYYSGKNWKWFSISLVQFKMSASLIPDYKRYAQYFKVNRKLVKFHLG